jgi:hypothetical protein
VIASSIVLLIAGVALAATHRPSGATYSREEVVRAFAVQGFTLTDAWMRPADFGREALLVPKTGEPFWVYVGTRDDRAKSYFATVHGFALPPETFDVLEKNVIVSSDSGLNQAQRRRVRVAMQLLRERPETLSALTECGKARPDTYVGGVTPLNSGIAASCLTYPADGMCEWWDAVSFREDGSVVSWTRGKTPDPALCGRPTQTDISIYDPTHHVKVELTSDDFVPSSARAEPQPGGSASLYVGFTSEGAAKFCRLTRDLARRGARLHREQHFAFAAGLAIYARPRVDHRANPEGICGAPGVEVSGMRPALARVVALGIRGS